MNAEDKLYFEHAVASFGFLIPRQRKTCNAGELATEIRQHFSLDCPRTAWTVNFLEERSEAQICRS